MNHQGIYFDPKLIDLAKKNETLIIDLTTKDGLPLYGVIAVGEGKVAALKEQLEKVFVKKTAEVRFEI